MIKTAATAESTLISENTLDWSLQMCTISEVKSKQTSCVARIRLNYNTGQLRHTFFGFCLNASSAMIILPFLLSSYLIGGGMVVQWHFLPHREKAAGWILTQAFLCDVLPVPALVLLSQPKDEHAGQIHNSRLPIGMSGNGCLSLCWARDNLVTCPGCTPPSAGIGSRGPATLRAR